MTDPVPVSSEPGAVKSALRRQLLAVRSARSPAAATTLGAGLARVFESEFGPLLTRGSWVAVYLSTGSELGTADIVATLARHGVAAIAPVLLDDGDLDWAEVANEPQAGRRATLEPAGARLGVDAITGARLVLVPALAVDLDGRRLGRGGGSYDRALLRVPRETLVLAVVDDVEIVDVLPSEPHDRRVDGALTPSGVRYFSTTEQPIPEQH